MWYQLIIYLKTKISSRNYDLFLLLAHTSVNQIGDLRNIKKNRKDHLQNQKIPKVDGLLNKNIAKRSTLYHIYQKGKFDDVLNLKLIEEYPQTFILIIFYC